MKNKMIKKTLPFRCSFLLLLTAGVLCLSVCKTEPDLSDDPHVKLVNPFIGVWKNTATNEYWQFKTDGTGGKAATAEGPFNNDFSFFIYSGQDVQTTPSEGSLVLVYDTAVTLYQFSINGNQTTLTGDSTVELERVSGKPQTLNLKNRLIGEWTAEWFTNDYGDHNNGTWSLKYREDGTVKTYHHEVKHQFENAYALRGDKLVIFGYMRFSIAPVISEIKFLEDGKLQITETQARPSPAKWLCTKTTAAEWLE